MAFSYLKIILILLSFSVFDIHSLTGKYYEYIHENTDENLKKLDHLEERDNAEEFSGQYEGDIVMTPEQMKVYKNKAMFKNGMLQSTYLWPDAIVPFQIRRRDYSRSQIGEIRKAMKIIEANSCVRFKDYNRKKHKNFITINAKEKGCFSFVGKQGGEQGVNFQPNSIGRGCFKIGTLVHELLHALGFMHMQSATERDDYVDIRFENIQSDFHDNFQKFGADMISSYDVEYDYGSVLHYSGDAFTKNGRDTIVPKRPLPSGVQMGQREKMSQSDIAKLKRMYCGKRNTRG